MPTDTLPGLASFGISSHTVSVPDTVEKLAHRYHAELMRILRARLPGQDADDLAQEAYTRLLRYEGRIKGDDLKRMLFRIASNLLTDHWRWMRLRKADLQLPIEEIEVQSEEPEHDRQLVAEQRLQRLEQIVLAMPEKRRAVFLLSRIQGLSNAEIAVRCAISIKTVEKHLALALAECRMQVGHDDGESL